MTTLRPGVLIAGSYRLEQPLGEGGYGEVWRAMQHPVDRPVAIKFLKSTAADPAAQKRFDVEARSLASINHPNCVTLFDYGHLDDGDGSYLVTELVLGQTADVWAHTNPDWPAIVSVGKQVCAALEAAHRRQVIHRDLKPANVMVSADPDGKPIVKVLDFGLAKMADGSEQNLTKTGEVMGTIGFMSPEQLRGEELGPPSDLYCLGCLLYELLQGVPPFRAARAQDVGLMHLLEPAPTVKRAVPPALRTIVAGLLEKDPRDRYATAGELGRAFDAIEENSPVEAAPEVGTPPPANPAPLPAGRAMATVRETAAVEHEGGEAAPPRWLLYAGGAAGLLLVVMAGFALMPRDEPPPPPPPVANNVKALLKSAKPTTPPAAPSKTTTTAPDASVAPVANVGGSLGCGREVRNGTYELKLGGELSRDHVLVHIPKSYENSVPHPIVVLFHENLQHAETVMDAGFVPLAERDGYLLVAPQGAAVGAWDSATSINVGWNTAQRVFDELCVDPDRIFIFGHAAGGFAAESLACGNPEIRAVATSSHRLTQTETLCEPGRRLPYLFIAPLKDGYDPVDGGTNALFGKPKLSLKENEQMLRQTLGCTSRRKKSTHKRGKCWKWDGCDLQVCHVDGGRAWGQMGYGTPLEGPVVPYPYAETIWEFLKTYDTSTAD